MEYRQTRSKRKTGRAPRKKDKKIAENFSELLEIIGTTRNAIERDNAGARILQRGEQLVKTTATKVTIGKKLIVCNRAVK